MKIVIDANIIIAMLIKPGKPIEVFFNEELEIFAPGLLFIELENNKEEIIEKSKLNKEEIDELFSVLKKKIKIIPEREYFKRKKEAEEICPDPKDIVYFALALYLKAAIWSNEKVLKEQQKIQVYATHEIMKLLNL